MADDGNSKDDGKVWTTDSDKNGNDPTTISRVPTVSANATKRRKGADKNPYLVGVQSRFKRKYFHKTIFISLLGIILVLLIIIIILATCIGNGSTPCNTKDCLRAAANLLQSMDQSVDPCDDFYAFTCGNWAEDHPRPDSSNSYDWFNEKQNKILRKIRHFLQSNATEDEPEAVKQSKDMYKACMDADSMDKIGLEPIFEYLQEFLLPQFPQMMNVTETVNYTFNLIDSLATIKKLFGADYIFGFDIFPDPANRSVNRLAIGSPETGSLLPFKNDYDKLLQKIQRRQLMEDDAEDDDSDAVKAYTNYMTEVMSVLVTYKNPKMDVEKIDFPALAKIAVKITKIIYKFTEEAENTTSKNLENPMEDLISLSLDEFQSATDHLIAPKSIPIWRQYLTTLFKDAPEAMLDLAHDLILTSKPDLLYLENVVDFLSNTTNAELEVYLWWAIVEELVVHTTSAMRKLHHDYAKQITNLESSTPRSLYCASGVNQLIGMPVSYAIADTMFLNHTKPMVVTMLNNIRESFNNLVRQTNWMDDATKCSTLEKSEAMKSLIGFPEWILNKTKLDEYYSDLHLNATTHLANMMFLLKWQMAEVLKSLKTVEEFGWATTPTNVNAFHTFQANAITIPLAILQYPFYNLGLEALNYGAIGSILGHELTHGFDDSGRMFDKEGNMRQWWSNRTIQEYVNRSSCFIKQYSEYYFPEVNDYINGELTLGENIADNGGLREAFYAYQLYMKKYGQEPRLIGFEKYTHNQLFFISYGNLWCETQTPTSAKWAIEDSHCPGKIRLKGVLSNSPEFSLTFGCKPNSGMYPKDRCRIW